MSAAPPQPQPVALGRLRLRPLCVQSFAMVPQLRSKQVPNGRKVPSFRIVKGVVERLKERDTIPPAIPYRVGDVLQIVARAGELRRYYGCWAIATDINEYTVNVCVHDGEVQLKAEDLKPIDSPDECHKVRKLAERIERLRECELDRGAYPILASLGRYADLTLLEEELLTFLEKWYLDVFNAAQSRGS